MNDQGMPAQHLDPGLHRPRRPWLAALLNGLYPGLGFLYVGMPLAAMLFAFITTLIFMTAAWLRLPLTPAGFYATLAAAALAWLIGISEAWIIARRQGLVRLAPWQHWFFYAAFVAVTMLVSTAVVQPMMAQRAELFGYDTYRLPSASMLPSLLPGDLLVVDTWRYRDRPIGRGDIIVYDYPIDPDQRYIKRAVGLPGETLEIRDGVVLINGRALREPYLPQAVANKQQDLPPGCRATRFAPIPEDAVVVLGDNRPNSNDSRCWGPLPLYSVRGRVEFVWASLGSDLDLRWDRAGQTVSPPPSRFGSVPQPH